MIYHLFEYLTRQGIALPFSRLFTYVSFRVGLALIVALLISTIWGSKVIDFLRRKQIGELVRDLGLEGEQTKKGTPTMGGVIIIMAILVPTLLFARLDNIYVILMIVTTLLMGLLGFADDYIKVFKKDKNGLKEHYKIFGQVFLGLIVGVTLYLSPSVVIKRNSEVIREGNAREIRFETTDTKSFQTSVPFVKDNNLDYSEILPIDDPAVKKIVGVTIFIMMTVFVVMLLSNGVNLTDGVDGLASGSSAIVGVVLGVLAYVSSHHDMAGYLNTMFIPGAEELVIFASTLVGATIGFLWYNSYPAQVFMGDTGSMFLGFILAGISVVGAVKSAATIALIVPILALGLPILDTTFAIVRRARNHRPIFKPDKGHLHHRLLARGFTQKQAVLLMYVVSALFGLCALALTAVSTQAATLIILIVAGAVFIGVRKLGILRMDVPQQK